MLLVFRDQVLLAGSNIRYLVLRVLEQLWLSVFGVEQFMSMHWQQHRFVQPEIELRLLK
jgi:hypothetical protein